MSQKTPPAPVTEIEAFCAICPPPQDVTALLAKLGFSLAFHMNAQDDLKRLVHLPALPPQYHYKHASGTEVLYLAGCDTPLDGERFPHHASRFWLYAGADAQAFSLVLSTLALQWGVTWHESSAHSAQKEVA